MIDRTELHAYVDGELSAEQAEAIRAQLKTSPADAREVEAIHALKSMLRDKTENPDISQSWAASKKRLNELDRTRRTERVVGRFAPGLCFGLLLFIVVAGQLQRRGHHSASQDLARFSSHLPNMEPADPNKLHWEDELIKQSFQSTPDHLEVRRVKPGSFDGIPVKEFHCRDQRGDLTIIAIGAPLKLDGMEFLSQGSDVRVGEMQGRPCVVGIQKGNTIIVTADRSVEELAGVAAHIKVE